MFQPTPPRTGRVARIGLCVVACAFGLAIAAPRHPSKFRLACGIALIYLFPWGWALLRPGRPARPTLIRFMACTLATLLGIAVFEIPGLLGMIDYRVPFSTPTPPWERRGNRPDPDLIYLKRGHQRVRESFTGNETPWLRGAGRARVYRSDRTYDRDGFRNPQDIGRADVIVIGDSFIEGAHVGEGDLVTTRLSHELGGRKGVVNLGQAGYGPEHELHVLRRFGIPRHPSVCIWAFYEGNDLADIDEYRIQRDRLAKSTGSEMKARFALSDRSFSANALGYVLREWIDPEPRRPASAYLGRIQYGPDKGVPFSFASGDYRRDSIPANQLERLREILREAASLCEERDIRLVIVFIPTKLRVYRKACRFEEGSICGKWPQDDLPEVLRDLVSGLPHRPTYLDLTEGFRALATGGTLLYLSDDTHWSVEGHRLAARLLSQNIH